MSLVKATISLFIITVLFCNKVAAEDFPHGCEVSGFDFIQNHLVVNDNGQQAFFLMQNISSTAIELQRIETREVFMSPSLAAKIEPSNWAAFASDIENLNFQCFIRRQNNTSSNEAINSSENPKPVQVDCHTVLEVCQYPRVKFALSNMGNYWVSINKAQKEVIDEATRKGIYLHW